MNAVGDEVRRIDTKKKVLIYAKDSGVPRPQPHKVAARGVPKVDSTHLGASNWGSPASYNSTFWAFLPRAHAKKGVIVL